MEMRGHDGFWGGADKVPLAALLHDLVMGGVTDEVGDVPFRWLGDDVSPIQHTDKNNVSAVLADVPQELQPERLPPPVPMPKARIPAAVPVASQVLVWSAGEPGGVVVVVRADPALMGKIPLQEPAMTLLKRMLAAVGHKETPVGFAVLGVGMEIVQPAMQGALKQTIEALNPREILVLGQVPLGTLVGQALGVEGWQAAPRELIAGFDGAVGVTYPPELLLARPLVKRLAWQHLQRWRNG